MLLQYILDANLKYPVQEACNQAGAKDRPHAAAPEDSCMAVPEAVP